MRLIRILPLALLAAGLSTGQAGAAPWRTQLLLAGNYRKAPVYVLTPTGVALGGVMAPQNSALREPAAVPVCELGRDLRRQALRVSEPRKFLGYVCQGARDGVVYSIPRLQGWMSRNRCLDRAYAYVSLRVERSGAISCLGYDRRPNDDPGQLLQ